MRLGFSRNEGNHEVGCDMALKEFENVRQDRTGFKRLFVDEQFDLYVWYNEKKGSITGFQLVYDKWVGAKAFTWNKGRGYRHNKIDGYDKPGSFETPILVRNGYFETKGISKQILEHSKDIEKEIVELVVRSIVEYDQTKDDQGI
jgi:hypothetical protein